MKFTTTDPLCLQSLPREARGYALFTAMVLLGLTMVLALVASRSGQLMHTIAANERAKSMADAGAEAALRTAERWLFDRYCCLNGMALVGDASASMGVYSVDAALNRSDLKQFMIPDRWPVSGGSIPGASTVTAGQIDFTGSTANATSRLASQPAFVIEDLGPARPGGGTAGEAGATGGSGYDGSGGMSPAGNSDLRVYRITAKSTGPTTQAISTMQSVFSGKTKG